MAADLLDTLQRYLHTELHAFQQLQPEKVEAWKADGRRFYNLTDLVLTLGTGFHGNERPDWCEQMEPNQCYANCNELVVMAENLTYYEGWAMTDRIILPVLHAWVVDETGKVIDPTWDHPENAAYFGVPLDWRIRMESNERSGYNAVLDSDWMADSWFLLEGWKLLAGVTT